MSDGPEILDNLLAKAQRSFEAAEGLLEDGHANFAASRAFYGCFSARSKEALLEAIGAALSAVIAADAQCFFEHAGYLRAAQLR